MGRYGLRSVFRVKTKPMNKAERRRAGIVKAYVGCLPCEQDDRDPIPSHLHHALDCGTRRGHMFSYGVCDSHHVGHECSVHKTKLFFNAKYGTDDELIAETDRRVAAFEARTTR